MLIDKLIAVNWGQLPIREYELGTITLLEGATGSGKSTLEDAIQTIMTAAHHGTFNYNAGQDEVAQANRSGKIPRSMASYFLGGEENRYMRETGAHGYVAAVFRNSVGEEAHVFTAIVGCSAELEKAGTGKGGLERRVARERDRVFLVVRNHALTLDDFTEIGESGRRRVRSVKEISDFLRRHYPARDIQDFRDNKKNYLTNLWGAMRNRTNVTDTDALQAAKTFSRAMAYKQIKNIHEFVRDEILERYDISNDIESLTNSIAIMRNLRSDAESISQNVEYLKGLETLSERIHDNWVQGVENGALRAVYKETCLRRELKSTQEERSAAAAEQAQASEHIRATEAEMSRLNQEIQQISAIRNQHQVLAQKGDYESFIEQAQGQFDAETKRLLGGLQEAIEAVEAFQSLTHQKQMVRQDEMLAALFRDIGDLEETIEAIDPAALLRRIRELSHADPAETALHETLAALERDVREVESTLALARETLHTGEGGVVDQVGHRLLRVSDEEKAARERHKSIADQIKSLTHERKVAYPQKVEQALRAIRENLPEARPRVLCDTIEVIDEAWQSSIEGYMGGNRFILLVEPKFEARAAKLARRAGAKVAQGEKAQRDMDRQGPLPDDSVCHLLRISDPVAKAYMHAQYGTVITVESNEALQMVSRGLTMDGYGAGGYTRFGCQLPDSQLVFGESGRQRAVDALYPELQNLEVTISTLEAKRGELRQLSRSLEAVRRVELTRPFEAMLDAARVMDNYRQRIANLDLTEVREIEAQHEQAQADLAKVTSQYRAAVSEEGQLRERVKTIDARIQRLNQNLDAALDGVDEQRLQLDKLEQVLTGYDAEAALERLREAAASPATTEASIDKEKGAIAQRLSKNFGTFRRDVQSYNQQAGREAHRIHLQESLETGQVDSWTNFYAFGEAAREVSSQLIKQRDNILAGMEKDLKEYEGHVSNSFTLNFCNIISGNIQRGVAQLDALNRILKQHRFTEEVYAFTGTWKPDMRRYYKFFDQLGRFQEDQESINIFEDDVFDEEQAQVRDDLVNLLFCSDDAQARRQLEVISDYRNYKEYDVLREREDGGRGYLSDFGTGSGGQFETPGYVLRAAAIMSAYRLNDNDSHHCRVVVLDEAFTKMDEPRALEVIRMLTDALKFQVVFAMPTKNAGPFYPWVTRKYAFSKQPSSVPIGELSTQVLVQSATPNPDKTREYWQRHREAVAEQARLDFEAQAEEDAPTGTAG